MTICVYTNGNNDLNQQASRSTITISRNNHHQPTTPPRLSSCNGDKLQYLKLMVPLLFHKCLGSIIRRVFQ